MTTRSVASTLRATSRASAALEANGFSTRTCLPASTAATVQRPCSEFGNGM